MSKPENDSNESHNNETTQINKTNSYQTRSKKNETESNKIDTINDKNTKINDKNDDDNSKLNSNSKIKIVACAPPKAKKSKLQKKPIMQSGSGLMPFTMHMNFLFFNVKKQIKKDKNEDDENNNEEDDENYNEEDDSESETREQLDLDMCPSGLKQELYDQVCLLREKRLDLGKTRAIFKILELNN